MSAKVVKIFGNAKLFQEKFCGFAIFNYGLKM